MSQRLLFFVEGQTEERVIADFLKRWLDARLDSPVGIDAVRFPGWAKLVADAPERTKLYLDGPKSGQIIAVIGLMDLYGPPFYPADKTTVKERWDWGRAYMENQVNNPRFRQFFAVHETEAWLLSDISRFPQSVQKALQAKAKTPEKINFKTPPAKLLDEIYLREMKRHYKKVTEAKNHFPHLSPDTAAEKCPYLKKMLEELLELVNAARHVEME